MLVSSVGMTVRVVDLPCRTVETFEVLKRNFADVRPEIEWGLRVLREPVHWLGKIPRPFVLRDAMHIEGSRLNCVVYCVTAQIES